MIPVPVNNFIHNLQLLFLQDQVHSKLEPRVVGPSMYCFFFMERRMMKHLNFMIPSSVLQLRSVSVTFDRVVAPVRRLWESIV